MINVNLSKEFEMPEYWKETVASSQEKDLRWLEPYEGKLSSTVPRGEFGGRYLSPLNSYSFIDADKGGYPKYLDWAELYIKRDGLIVADNTLLFNTVFLESPPKEVSEKSWHAMREFNRRLSDEEKYYSMLIPTDERMTVALKLT
jgi:hypothetical protein